MMVQSGFRRLKSANGKEVGKGYQVVVKLFVDMQEAEKEGEMNKGRPMMGVFIYHQGSING
jgi:hypothetical protein